jgi:hypothetical protein
MLSAVLENLKFNFNFSTSAKEAFYRLYFHRETMDAERHRAWKRSQELKVL